MGKKFCRLLEGAMHTGVQEINGDGFERRRIIISAIFSGSLYERCYAAAAVAAAAAFRKA